MNDRMGIGRNFALILWFAVLVVLSVIAPRSGRADQLDIVANQIRADATLEAKAVWSKLGLPAKEGFEPRAVSIAYAKLSQKRTRENAVANFLQLPSFLHLVKQSVMLSAALHGLDIPAARFFKATWEGVDAPVTLERLNRMYKELQRGYPWDPNSLDGPVRLTEASEVPSNPSAQGQTQLVAFRSSFEQVGKFKPAVATCSYTIQFENTGTGNATKVIVSDEILPTVQAINTFFCTEITWVGARLYPVAYEKGNGTWIPIPAGSLAPTPHVGQTFKYRFSNGKIMTFLCSNAGPGITFEWRFDGWILSPKESGSVSFVIDPIGEPTPARVANPGAFIIFDTNKPMQTNRWIRPGTAF